MLDLLAAVSQRWLTSERPSIICNRSTISYRGLADSIITCESKLRRLGVERGSIVLLKLENSPELVVSILAVMRLGAVALSINPREGESTISEIVEELNVEFIIKPVEDPQVAVAPYSENIELFGRTLHVHQLRVKGDKRIRDQMAEAGVISIQVTSGSTGRPKCIAHTAEGFAATVFRSDHLREHLGQRLFLGIPISNSYGLTQLLEFLYVDAAIVISNGFGTPDDMWRALTGTQATVIEGPPSVFEILIRSSSLHEKGLPYVRRIGMAGGKIRPQLVRKLWELIPDVDITNRYGVTEISGGLCRTHLNRAHVESGEIPCGPAFPFVELRVSDGTGKELPPGKSGEIVVKSPGLLWGYIPEPYKKLEYMTGDIGHLTEDGCLCLVDRISSLVKRDGVRIHPSEVERCLVAAEGVKDCMVLGHVNTNTAREELHAVIVMQAQSAFDRSALVRHCLHKLSKDKLPDCFHHIPEIPLRSNGKADIKRLRALLYSR